MNRRSIHRIVYLGGPMLALIAGCSSMETPAASAIAVSGAAAEHAANAGAMQYAPVEMNAARDKLAQAQSAMAAKNYEAARDWALMAQADANLAQVKANSAKAQSAAAAVQEDIRILREELSRSSGQ